MNELLNSLSVISIVLTLAAIIGGIVAYRNGVAKTAYEIQERVINALESELDTLRQRLDDMKDENTRLRLVIDTICAALKSRGMVVTIEGDMVSIQDQSGKSTIKRIHEEQDVTCQPLG